MRCANTYSITKVFKYKIWTILLSRFCVCLAASRRRRYMHLRVDRVHAVRATPTPGIYTRTRTHRPKSRFVSFIFSVYVLFSFSLNSSTLPAILAYKCSAAWYGQGFMCGENIQSHMAYVRATHADHQTIIYFRFMPCGKWQRLTQEWVNVPLCLHMNYDISAHNESLSGFVRLLGKL